MNSPAPASVAAPLPRFESHSGKAFLAATLAVFGTALFIPLAILIKDIVPPPVVEDPMEPTLVHAPKWIPAPVDSVRNTDSSATIRDAPKPARVPPDLKPLPFDLPRFDPTTIGGIAVLTGFEGFAGQDVLATTIEELDSIPALLVSVSPHANRIDRSLSVYAEMIVDRTGHVTQVRILESDDNRLNEAVERAVRKWQFQPGMQNGKVVPFRLRQRFHFTP